MEFLYKTLGECLKETCGKYPKQTAMEFQDWSCTFEELDRITDYLAGRMHRKYDINKGTHVGIWSVNTPSYVFTFLALAKIGAVPCVLNTFYKVEEMSRILMQADIEVLFYGAGSRDIIYDELIPEIRRRTPTVRHFLHADEREAGVWLSEDSFYEEEKTPEALAVLDELKNQVDCKDPCCIIFTSGTTSEPKGAVLSHFNVVNDVAHVQKCMRWTHEDKMCVVVPLFHCFGLVTAVVGSMVIGFTLHIIPYFKSGPVWKAIHEHHCTIMIGVPSMFMALVGKDEYKDLDGSSLKTGIVGGSVLPADDYLRICQRFSNMRLQTSFGMTEMSASVSFTDWDEPIEKKAVTTGRLMEDIEGRIVDPQTGKILGKNEHGEIQFRGFNVMQGYYNMPDKTAAVFTEDGWFRTGDIGYFNDDDELCISGRLKEMIIRSGENISPSEIEEVIVRSGMVDKVKVVGVPSKFYQEEVAACIVTRDGKKLDHNKFFDFVRPRLAVFKIPQYILYFDNLPMTASGKIDLKTIQKEAAELAATDNDRRYVRED